MTPLLGALQVYQLSIPAPPPPAGSFDVAAAGRGERVFNAQRYMRGVSRPPLFTEPGLEQSPAKEMGIDDFQAARSPDHSYRTTPLEGALDL